MDDFIGTQQLLWNSDFKRIEDDEVMRTRSCRVRVLELTGTPTR